MNYTINNDNINDKNYIDGIFEDILAWNNNKNIVFIPINDNYINYHEHQKLLDIFSDWKYNIKTFYTQFYKAKPLYPNILDEYIKNKNCNIFASRIFLQDKDEEHIIIKDINGSGQFDLENIESMLIFELYMSGKKGYSKLVDNLDKKYEAFMEEKNKGDEKNE